MQHNVYCVDFILYTRQKLHPNIRWHTHSLSSPSPAAVILQKRHFFFSPADQVSCKFFKTSYRRQEVFHVSLLQPVYTVFYVSARGGSECLQLTSACFFNAFLWGCVLVGLHFCSTWSPVVNRLDKHRLRLWHDYLARTSLLPVFEQEWLEAPLESTRYLFLFSHRNSLFPSPVLSLILTLTRDWKAIHPQSNNTFCWFLIWLWLECGGAAVSWF